jgi:hypothetical protein
VVCKNSYLINLCVKAYRSIPRASIHVQCQFTLPKAIAYIKCGTCAIARVVALREFIPLVVAEMHMILNRVPYHTGDISTNSI